MKIEISQGQQKAAMEAWGIIQRNFPTHAHMLWAISSLWHNLFKEATDQAFLEATAWLVRTREDWK